MLENVKVAQIKKFKKQSPFIFEFCFWEDLPQKSTIQAKTWPFGQKLSELSKIVEIVKDCQNCQKSQKNARKCNGRSNQKVQKTKSIYLLILLLGGPSPPTKMYMKA